MVTVGIRDLKNQLSSYLRLVSRGETVMVMDHKNLVAEIKKPSLENLDDRIEKFFSEGIRSGSVLPAKRNKSTLSKSDFGKISKINWRPFYDQSRGDR